MPAGARNLLSRALIDVATTAVRIGNRVNSEPPVQGSLAELVFNDTHDAAIAATGISAGFATVTDYLHAVARLLRLEEEFGPSIAALVRGFIESAGRLWWLLDVRSPEELAHRATVMHLKEVETTAKRGVALVRINSEGVRSSIDAEDAVKQAKDDLARVGAGRDRISLPSYTELATGLLAASGVKNPRAEYSHLSGAAHGEVSSTAGFGSKLLLDSHRMTLGLPISNAQMYLWDIDRVMDLLMNRLVDVSSREVERERWVAARDRMRDTAEKVFQLLDDSMLTPRLSG